MPESWSNFRDTRNSWSYISKRATHKICFPWSVVRWSRNYDVNSQITAPNLLSIPHLNSKMRQNDTSCHQPQEIVLISSDWFVSFFLQFIVMRRRISNSSYCRRDHNLVIMKYLLTFSAYGEAHSFATCSNIPQTMNKYTLYSRYKGHPLYGVEFSG